MTIEESRLEDLAKKAEHIQRTGYDYSKEVQSQIQNLVEVEVEKSLKNPRIRTSKHLVPTPGLYNNDILIKKEDIYAYKQSHPQVAAPLSKRRAIIEALKSGNSIPSEKRVTSKASKSNEETKIKLLSTQGEEINKYSFMSRDEYREWFTDLVPYIISNSKSCHHGIDYDIVVSDSYLSREVSTAPKVLEKSVKLKLATSNNVYPPLSENNTHKIINNTLARASLKKSSTIGELPKDTEIILIDDYCHDGSWAIAKTSSYPSYGSFFVLRSDIGILEGVSEHPKKMDLKKSMPSPSAVSIDWTTQKVGVPYYDASDAKHKVSVETTFKTMSSVSNILTEGFNKGKRLILENIGKSTDESTLESIIENNYYEKSIRATDIYVNDRKDSNILVLVEAPHRYVSTLPDETRTKSVYYCEDYDSSSLLNQINQVASKIGLIQNDIEKYDGSVLNFDAKREKDNLLSMASTVKELFSKNGFNGDVLKTSGIITMKWDANFKMIGLEYESEDASQKILVTEGLLEENSKEHMESQRIQQLIYTLYEIVSEGLEKPWTQFLQDYVSYDIVEIISKKSNTTSQLDEKEAGPVKTLEQYNKEQNYYANLDRKFEKANTRESDFEFSGSSLLDEATIGNLKENISSDAKEAYNKFLNNVDFRKIVLQSVKSLIPEKINKEMDDILAEAEKIEKDIYKYKARIEDGIEKARHVKDEAVNTVEQGLEYLRNAGDYFPKIVRDFEIQGTGDIDFDVAGSMDIMSEVIQNPQEVQAYMKQIKNIESPVFETMSRFPGGENFVNEASETLAQVSEFSLDTGTINESVLDNFANKSGLDDQTNNLLKEGAMSLIKGGSLDFKKVTHFPQMKYDDMLPTDDISEAFFENLMDSMSSMLNERIKHLVKTALGAAETALFSNGNNAGKKGNSPGDTFENQDVSVNKEEVKPLVEKMFGPSVSSDDVQNVLDDVGNLLSPREFCDLLSGNPNEVTLNVSKSMIRAAYPQMHLNTSSKIRDFFLSISKFSNYDNCDEISKEIPEYITDDYLCPPNSSLREGILKEKGMSDSQIKDQLERERDRSRKLAEDLLDQLKSGLLSGNSKAPNNFCSKTPEGKVKPGQNSFMDDNFRYTLQSTVIKTFEPVYTSFKTDSDTFIDSLFSNQGDKGRRPLVHIQKLSTNKGHVTYIQSSKQIEISLPIEETLPDLGASENSAAAAELRQFASTSAASSIKILETSSQPGEIQNTIQLPSNNAVFTKQKISQSYLNYARYGVDEYVTSKGFLEKILLNSYSSNTNITEQQMGLIKESSQEIQNKVRTKFFSNIFNELKSSPYMKDIGKADAEVKSPEYILDFVNVCPPPNDSCDPHLLNVRGEVDKIYNSFKDDMCASPNSDSEETNPLEGAMMSSCVGLILRHYIVETLLKGIASLSVTQGKSRIDRSILRYVLLKMKRNMKTYSNHYYDDFKKFAEQSYQGTKCTGEEVILDMMEEEYNKISRLLFEVLFLGNNTRSYRQKVIDSIPIIKLTLDPKDNIMKSTTNNVNVNSPLVMVESEDSLHLCLAIEQPNGLIVEAKPKFTDFYRKSSFDDLVPIASSRVGGSKDELFDSVEFNIILDVCFPVDVFSSAIFIHEIETASRIDDIDMAFGNTRDILFSIFHSIKPEAEDWKKESPILKELGETTGMGGGASLTALWDFNFGVFDTPVTDNTFNFGLPLGWGNSFKGLFFSFAAKAIKDAAMKTFKDSVETADPNIVFSKKLSKQIKLAGKNVSTTEISVLMSLVNPLAYPQTPSSIAYHALGLGSYIKNKIDTSSEEGAEKANKIENTGLKMPQLCEEMLLD
tara:strand:- start:1747 stop:7194 length:5448 start_codon:yes stop_codon:yes gene_type:complete